VDCAAARGTSAPSPRRRDRRGSGRVALGQRPAPLQAL